MEKQFEEEKVLTAFKKYCNWLMLGSHSIYVALLGISLGRCSEYVELLTRECKFEKSLKVTSDDSELITVGEVEDMLGLAKFSV